MDNRRPRSGAAWVYFAGEPPKFTRIPDGCQPLKAVVVSRLYAEPANRGKLEALAALGCSITAVVPTPVGDAATPAAGDQAGVGVVPIPARRSSERELRWSRRALRRALAELRPELVQVEEEPWTEVAGAVAALARRLRYRLCLFSAEGIPAPLSPAARLRRARALRRASGLLAGNRLAQSHLGRLRPGLPQARVPQLGVPPAREPRPPGRGGDLVIGFVGRLVPEKGLDLLFRACVRLGGRWRVEVVGSGPSQEELEGLAERLGIAAKVTWHGGLPRFALDPLWPAFDCLVMPSRTTPRWVETRAQAAVVAMSHGVPVVATDSGALPDVVGPAGRIVPEDDIDRLAAALQELVAEPRLRDELGALARERVLAEFTDRAVAERTLAFWRAMLAAPA